MAEDSFSIGNGRDSRFRESVVSQLSAIAARLNVRVADLGGSTSDYSGGPASRFSGTGRGRGSGRAGSRSLGGGGDTITLPRRPIAASLFLVNNKPRNPFKQRQKKLAASPMRKLPCVLVFMALRTINRASSTAPEPLTRAHKTQRETQRRT